MTITPQSYIITNLKLLKMALCYIKKSHCKYRKHQTITTPVKFIHAIYIAETSLFSFVNYRCMGAMFLTIILLYHTFDDNTCCNVRISNYRSEHQIKYLSSFVAFKCFGFSVFTLAASQSAAPVRAWMGSWLSLVCDLKCVVVLIAFLSLQLSALKCDCLKCPE